MIPLLTTIMSVLGRGVNAFFGFKEAQGNVINSAIGALSTITESDSSYATASSTAIASVYQSGPIIERLWRPCLMWIIMTMIVGRWFGWHMLQGLPEVEIARIYDWMEIGLIGYVPLRSFEKIMRGFQIGSVLKSFVGKKLL